MMNYTGPGSGISPLSATWSMLGAMRNAQAEMRAVQKANGHSTLGDTGALNARAVAQVQAADKARGTTLQDGARDGTVDPLLTGPRPTFDKTPLEKMRTDAMLGPLDRIEQATTGTDTPAETQPERPSAPDPKAAYTGLRDIDAPNAHGATLDKTT